MDKWNEFRTAYQVAKHGTVSEAAKALGVHRATIIRHIDSLEKELGGKIFFRNKRGYSLTEIGEDLLRVAESTEDQFRQFIGRSDTRAPGISTQLIISTIDVVCQTITDAMHHYVSQNPQSQLRSILTPNVVKLEYGEAHVAIRAGSRPADPDYVVMRLEPMRTGLYAHKTYTERYGSAQSTDALSSHRFVGYAGETPRGPYAWLSKYVPEVHYCLISDSFHCRLQAIMAGIGMGFLPEKHAQQLPDLKQVIAPNRTLDTKLWLVTHGATHRTAKVQSFLRSLRATGHLQQNL